VTTAVQAASKREKKGRFNVGSFASGRTLTRHSIQTALRAAKPRGARQ
jgi:hypothetical protein